MKAIVYDEYGLHDVLRVDDVRTPVLEADEVLLAVRATAVNPGDWDLLRGLPYVLRLSTGVRRPKRRILGLAVAGVVEEVGADVDGFGPGDEVFAEVPGGGFSQYLSVSADDCAPKPASLSFEEAAAVPLSAVTALQGLRDAAGVEPGMRVLINGASGGVGIYAIQLAKIMDAEVTGVCSTQNVELVSGLGADHVIDYTVADFTVGERHDVILDNVGNRSLGELRSALSARGTLIPNSNKGDARWLGTYLRRAVRGLATSPFVRQRIKPFAATSSAADLATLTEYIEAGRLRPIIDRTYPLDATGDALRYYGQGHVRGKVVVTL